MKLRQMWGTRHCSSLKLVEVRAFPPFPQKEAERMGHGVFLAEPQFLRMKALAS
jgi:hypothetical protein